MPSQSNKPNRRSFLAESLAITAATVSSSALSSATASKAGAAVVSTNSARTVADRHDLMRSRIEIDVKGNVKISENALASRETQQTFPVNSKAILDYEERVLAPAGADEESSIVAAERFYHTAWSESVLNKTSTRQELRPSMRQTIVRRESLPETIYSPDNFFTHGELSLLKSPVSSVSVDRLLPGENVFEGDRYEIDYDVLCSVLNLSLVENGKVDCEVIEIDAQAVRFELSGEIEGSVDGVGTRLRLRGKMTFSRRENTCTWLALAIHETREISRAEPGFDVAATIKMVRRPMAGPVGLAAEPTPIDFDAQPPINQLYVELQSRQLGVGTMMDRRWRMMNDVPGSAVMRMIDHDVSVAQCNLRGLVPLPDDKQWTLEAFEAGVRQTLGDQLSQLIEGDQRVTAQGLRVLRIVADGETQGVPIRWIMMHFSDDQGRRVQATFTMSGDKVEAFAGNDAQLADSLRFLAPEEVHDGKPADSGSLADQPNETPQVASGDTDGQRETGSASDLR